MEEKTVKRHPLYNDEKRIDEVDGLAGLFVDEFADMGELTEGQQSDKFMSKYLDTSNPVGKFPEYFASTAKTVDHILKEVKTFHKRLVLNGAWSEEKYIEVIEQIFENKIVLSIATVDRGGLMYDGRRRSTTKPSEGRKGSGGRMRSRSSANSGESRAGVRTRKRRIISQSEQEQTDTPRDSNPNSEHIPF